MCRIAEHKGEEGGRYEHRVARRDDGGRLGAAGRLRPAPRRTGSRGPRRRSQRPSSVRCCCSTRTTCATSRARRSGRGSATRTSASRSCSRDDDPILWDFGSAARHHQLYCPWLPESSWRAWVPPMRGAMPDETGVPDALADDDLRASCASAGSRASRVGMDVPDMTTLLALQRKGIEIADSQPVMLEARKLKTRGRARAARPRGRDRRRGLRGDLPHAAAGRDARTRSSPPR